jgi:hypothetical protein
MYSLAPTSSTLPVTHASNFYTKEKSTNSSLESVKEKVELLIQTHQTILNQPQEILLTQLYYATESAQDFYNLSLVNKVFHALENSPKVLETIFSQPIANLTRQSKKVVIFLKEYAVKYPELALKLKLRLDFSHCLDLDDRDLFDLSFFYKNIEELTLPSCKGITDSGLSAFIERCKNLKYINFYGLQDTLESLSHNCSDLRVLQFNILSESENYLALHSLSHLKNLESLSLDLCQEDAITDFMKLIELKPWPKLKHLAINKFNNNAHYSLKSLKNLIEGSPHIESLHWGRFHDATDLNLLSQCKNLQKLIIRWQGGDPFFTALINVFMNCEKIKHLEFYPDVNSGRYGEAFVKVIDSLPQNLESIVFYVIPHDKNCALALIKRCPHLKRIELHSSRTHTSPFVRSFAQNCSLPLLAIALKNHPYELDVIELTKRCPDLKTLILHQSIISKKAIEAIVTHCKELAAIELSNIYDNLNEEALLVLSKGCSKLKSLTLVGVNLKKVFFQESAINWKELEYLHIMPLYTRNFLNNYAITPPHINGLELIAKQCRNLKHLSIQTPDAVAHTAFKLVKNNLKLKWVSLEMPNLTQRHIKGIKKLPHLSSYSIITKKAEKSFWNDL